METENILDKNSQKSDHFKSILLILFKYKNFLISEILNNKKLQNDGQL